MKQRVTKDQVDKLLDFLGKEWDVTTCSECGEPILVEMVTGEPQTCHRLKCAWKAIKGQV